MTSNGSFEGKTRQTSRWYLRARKTQFYLMLIIYMVLATARPEDAMPAGYNDLVVHFIAYVVLYNSSLLAYGARTNRLNMYLGLLAYSFMIEIVQYFLPYRSFSLLDMLANALGLYAGMVTGAILIQVGRKLNAAPVPDHPGG